MSFFTIIFIRRVSSAHINKFIFINFLLFVIRLKNNIIGMLLI